MSTQTHVDQEPTTARSARSLMSNRSFASSTTNSSSTSNGDDQSPGNSGSSSSRRRAATARKDWKNESLAKWVRLAENGGIGEAVALKDNVAASKRWLMFLTGDVIVILLELVHDEVYLGFCEGVIGQFRATDVEINSLKRSAAPSARIQPSVASSSAPAPVESPPPPQKAFNLEEDPREPTEADTSISTVDSDLLSPTPVRPRRPSLGERAASSSSTTATLGTLNAARAPRTSGTPVVASSTPNLAVAPPSREPSPAVSDSDPFALDFEVEGEGGEDDRRSSRNRHMSILARKSSAASTRARALKQAGNDVSDLHIAKAMPSYGTSPAREREEEVLATPRPDADPNTNRPASPARSLADSVDSYDRNGGGGESAHSSRTSHDGRYDAEWDVFARYTRESVYHAPPPQQQVSIAADVGSSRSAPPLLGSTGISSNDEPATLASRLRLRIQNADPSGGGAVEAAATAPSALPTLSPDPTSSPTVSDRSDHLQTPHHPSTAAFEGDVMDDSMDSGGVSAGDGGISFVDDERDDRSPYDGLSPTKDVRREWKYESSGEDSRAVASQRDQRHHLHETSTAVYSPTSSHTPTLSPTLSSSPRPNISNPPNPYGQAKPRGAFFPAPEREDRPRSQSFSHFHFDRLEVPLPTEGFVPEALWLEEVSPPSRKSGHARQKSTASSLRSKMSKRGKTPEPGAAAVVSDEPPATPTQTTERKPRRSLSIKSLRSKRETTPTPTPTKLELPPMPKLTKQSSRVTPSDSAISSRDYFGTVSHDGTDFQVAQANEFQQFAGSRSLETEEDEWGFIGTSPVPVIYRKHGRNVPKTEQAMLAIIAKKHSSSAAKKLGKMLASDGAPPSIRFRVWSWLLAAPTDRSAESHYHRLVDRYSAPKIEVFAIPPAFASHRAFAGDGSARLQEMIATLRYHKPKSYMGEGTCWLAMILFMQAFDVSHAFVLTDIVLDKFASQMSPDVIRTDAVVLESMVVEMDAKLALHLKACGLNYEDLCRHWFTSFFASTLPYPTVLDILSLIFADGYSFALRTGLAIISLQSKRLQQLRDGQQVAQCLLRPAADELLAPSNVLRACEGIALTDDKLMKRRSKVKK